MPRTAVVALGGNAITRSGESGTYDEQARNARGMATAVSAIVDAGWRVVLVHGNGPQIGTLAAQQLSAGPAQPLHVLGAMTEGQLGSLLVLALHEAGVPGAVTVCTHVVVDAGDPAFERPTKPIGPFFSESHAHDLAARHGWTVGEDSGRGYRRLVASPLPREIVELDAVAGLVARGAVVVAAGGGGVPVVRSGAGYRGVDAVIDKDLAAARLATALGAEALVLVTDVAAVMLDYGTPTARAVTEMSADDAATHAAAGQFPEGSMGPKVRGCVQFLRAGGCIAVITSADLAADTLAARPGSGTRIVSPRCAGGGTAGEGAA